MIQQSGGISDINLSISKSQFWCNIESFLLSRRKLGKFGKLWRRLFSTKSYASKRYLYGRYILADIQSWQKEDLVLINIIPTLVK